MKVVIEDVHGKKTTLTTQAGDSSKQEVNIAVNTTRGVEMFQVEVWDDNIDKMALQPNEVVTLHAGIVPATISLANYNTPQAYKAERGTDKQDAAQVQTDEVF